MVDKLLAKKSLQDLSREASDTTHGLKRVLGSWHLVFLMIYFFYGLRKSNLRQKKTAG